MFTWDSREQDKKRRIYMVRNTVKSNVGAGGEKVMRSSSGKRVADWYKTLGLAT